MRKRIPYQPFDYEIDNGWKDLVLKLIEDLKAIGWNGEIAQIKEKFGGLRFYIGEGTIEMFKLIDKAECKSYSICIRCGQPGVLRGTSWPTPLCDVCGEGKPICDEI